MCPAHGGRRKEKIQAHYTLGNIDAQQLVMIEKVGMAPKDTGEKGEHQKRDRAGGLCWGFGDCRERMGEK